MDQRRKQAVAHRHGCVNDASAGRRAADPDDERSIGVPPKPVQVPQDRVAMYQATMQCSVVIQKTDEVPRGLVTVQVFQQLVEFTSMPAGPKYDKILQPAHLILPLRPRLVHNSA
ncbi:MAG: hypothetical protein CWE10_13990 [Symbiobacterium thermophilum]|uniref:Uncharacterized protein n=1 Tax=Symbiobacterium thermophilum TaxID=2734 RepID=A0A953IDE0_SYMTR|nr:hypothetical protein [Symbiobacterium thermophilum]